MLSLNQTHTTTSALISGKAFFDHTTSLSTVLYSNSTAHDYNMANSSGSLQQQQQQQQSPAFLQGLITKHALGVVFKVNSVGIIFVVGLLGSVLSLVNSVVFFKQGLKDPVTTTLFVLALADFGSVITLWLRSVFFILLFFPDAIPSVDPSYFSGLFAWPHAVLVRVSCFLTAFIAFERWVCITFPLHANRIITLPVAKGYNLVVSTVLIATFISLYCYSRIELRFLPQENRSLFILTLTLSGFKYAQVLSTVYVTIYLATFSLLILFTILIIIKLNQQTKWRQGVSSSSATESSGTTSGKDNAGQKIKSDAISAKNRKVVNMVVAICLIYIVFTIPSVTNTLVYIYVPGYVEYGRYYNLYQLNNQLCFTFEVINSTCNFFIYFRMSSNFSNTLRRLMGKETK